MTRYGDLSLTGMLDCGYRNGSDRMVIVRCVGPDEFFLERVVFPFELLSFRCPLQTQVEIWSHSLGGAELVETIAAEELGIDPSAEQPLDLPSTTGPLEEPATLVTSPWLEAG